MSRSAWLVLALTACHEDPPNANAGTERCSVCGGANQPTCALESAPSSAADSCLRPLATYDGAGDLVISVAWSPIDDYVLSGANGELRLLQVAAEPASFRDVDVFRGQTGRTLVAWSPDGQFALSGSTDVRLLAVARSSGTISQIAPAYAAGGAIFALDWSPDGAHALSAGEDGTARLLAVDSAGGTLTELASFDGRMGKVYAVDWSPDGRFAAIAVEDGTARLLAVDVEQGSLREVARIAEDASVATLAWSPRGSELLTGTWVPCATVRLLSLDAAAGLMQPMSLYSGHSSGVRVVLFRPDGSLAATAGHDDTVRLFAFAGPGRTLEHIATWLDNPFGVHEVSWSPDGMRMLVAASRLDRLTLVDASQCAQP